MIIVKPFKAVDFELILPHAIDESAKDIPIDQIRARAAEYEACSCGFTGWWDDTPLGSLGVIEVRPGVGNMWSLLHKDIRRHIVPSMRAVKEMLRVVESMTEYGFKRLRSDSRIGFPESQRFLEFLGFTKQRRNMNSTHYYYRRDVICPH